MKTVTKRVDGRRRDVARVSDAEAERMVAEEGFRYASKRTWRRAILLNRPRSKNRNGLRPVPTYRCPVVLALPPWGKKR